MLNKRILIYPLFALCLILAACTADSAPEATVTPQPDAPATALPQQAADVAQLGETFSLTVEQSMIIEEAGITLTFEEVERDGRCPSAVTCVADGPVILIISVDQKGQPLTTFTMNPDPQKAASEGIPSNIFSLVGYEVELTAVEPYPEQPEDLMNMDYRGTFIVTESSLDTGNIVQAEIDSAFTLEVGQTAAIQVADLILTFDMVVSDNRCPTAVDCFQDGPVIVQISAKKGDAAVAPLQMNPDPQKAALEGNPPNAISFEGYEIELTAVDPYPVQPEDIMNMNYIATIIVR